MNPRPVYETEQNLSQEQAVALTISKAWDIGVRKLKKLYPFDWAFIYEGEVTGFLEIKCRTNASADYADYMISADKIRWACSMISAFDCRCILAVQWTDRLGAHNINPEQFNYVLEMGGRNDRGDDQDIEPVVKIPLKWFKTIDGKSSGDICDPSPVGGCPQGSRP